MAKPADATVDRFIARWRASCGGQERANYAMFLYELCDVLSVTPPDPAGDPARNDYVFERLVRDVQRDGSVSDRRIDLYKRDCFILEAKQSRQWKGGAPPGCAHGATDRHAGPALLGHPALRWDRLMNKARAQAENYVRLLPQDHSPPPFVIVCDVGNCFELYANFRRDGKAYGQFPDVFSFRIYLEDLRRLETRVLLQAIWTEPLLLASVRRQLSQLLPASRRRAS